MSNEGINDAISAAIVSGTFGLEAIEGIKSLKDLTANQEIALKAMSEELSSARAAGGKLEIVANDLRSKNQSYSDIIAGLKGEIANNAEVVAKAVASNAESEAMRWCMQTVFKPANTRRTVQTGSYAHQNGDGSSTPVAAGEQIETHPED